MPPALSGTTTPRAHTAPPPRTARLGAALLRLARRQWTSLATAVMLLLSVCTHAFFNGFHRVTDFVEIGRVFAGPFGLLPLATSPVGYDGQYYYFIARFPGWVPPGGFDRPAMYYSRMLYPFLIHLFSLGSVSAMPWAMLAINLVAIVGAVALISRVLRDHGLPQWYALIAGFYCGQPLAMLRDLSDPLGVFWLALALFGVSRGRWLLAAAALGFGLLTRESTLPFVLCFAAPLALAQSWRTLLAFAAVALGPFLAWALVIHTYFGVWGLAQTANREMFLPLPFAGLSGAGSPRIAAGMVIFVCVPLLFGISLGLRAFLARRPLAAHPAISSHPAPSQAIETQPAAPLARRHLRSGVRWTRAAAATPATSASPDALLLVAALGAILYGVFMLLEPAPEWADIWGPMRLAAPIVVCIPLLLPAGKALPRWYFVPALMIASAALALLA